MTSEEVSTSATLLGEPLPVELMNTVGPDRGEIYDALEDDAGVAAWLRAVGERIDTEAGVELGALDEDAVHRVARPLRELRDALRRLAMEATEDPRPPASAPALTRPEAIAKVNSLAQARPELVWPDGGDPSRAYRARGSSANLAVGLIAQQGVELFGGELRYQLRPCLAPNCPLFFLKNHPRREWCTPACGNRARVARHFRRHQATRRN